MLERPNDRTTERPNDRTTERPNDRTTERPNERTNERTNERPMKIKIISTVDRIVALAAGANLVFMSWFAAAFSSRSSALKSPLFRQGPGPGHRLPAFPMIPAHPLHVARAAASKEDAPSLLTADNPVDEFNWFKVCVISVNTSYYMYCFAANNKRVLQHVLICETGIYSLMHSNSPHIYTAGVVSNSSRRIPRSGETPALQAAEHGPCCVERWQGGGSVRGVWIQEGPSARCQAQRWQLARVC